MSGWRLYEKGTLFVALLRRGGVMQYFTEEAIHWEAPPKSFKAASDAYKTHLEELWPDLPPELQELAHTDLQDGLVRQVVVDHQAGGVILRLRCGCFQDPRGKPVGYFDLDINYCGVVLMPPELKSLKEAGRNRVELLYNEIEREPNGLFLHRSLCSGFAGRLGEMVIRFRELKLIRTPREQRYGRLGWPYIHYVEIPSKRTR